MSRYYAKKKQSIDLTVILEAVRQVKDTNKYITKFNEANVSTATNDATMVILKSSSTIVDKLF